MNNFNTGASRIKYNTADGEIENRINNDDYVDLLIKKLQSIALPRYKASDKLVNPPMVAVRFGDAVFIKGISMGGYIPFTSTNTPIINTL